MALGDRKMFVGAAAATTLAAPIGANDLTFTVATGTGSPFPDGSNGDFPIDLDSGSTAAERILCESRTGDVFTVKADGRGHDGTAAQAHAATFGGVTHGIDAETMNDLEALAYDATRDGGAAWTVANLGADIDTKLATYGESTVADVVGGLNATYQTLTGHATHLARNRINVLDLGATRDGRSLSDGAITSGTATLTSATARWDSTRDVGKQIWIEGAGAAGAQLATTISAVVNAGQVTLADNASTTITANRVVWGTPDTDAIRLAVEACRLAPGEIYFPASPTGITGDSAVAVTASGTTVTSASNPWTADDVGKPIVIIGAGTAGADLVSVIDSFTGTGEIEIADAAVTTVSGARAVWIDSDSTGYILDESIVYTSARPAETQIRRGGGIGFVGDNMYASVIHNVTSDYAFECAQGADSLSVEKLTIRSDTGGGWDIPEGGTIVFDRFMMDGCGAGKWGIYANSPYQLKITNSRFWAIDDAYAGGAIHHDDGHTIVIDNTFVSKQKKDGDIVYLANLKNISIPTLTLESNPDGAAFTAQSMLVLDGNNICVDIGTLHGENLANTLIEIRSGGGCRMGRFGTIHAWMKNTSGYGDPDGVIIDNSGLYKIDVESIFWKHDSTTAPSGNGDLIVDSGRYVNVKRWSENASGGQSGRGNSIIKFMDSYESGVTGGTTTTPGTTFQLGGPGTYVVSVTIERTVGEHGLSKLFYLAYDDDGSFDWGGTAGSVPMEIGTLTKGSAPPTSLTLAVSNAGVVTVTGAAPSAAYYTRYAWRKFSRLFND